jgi:hypothetical protein
VKLNTTAIASGHYLENNSNVVALNSGLYNYQFSIQVISTNASQKEVYIWYRQNGVDVPNSASRVSIVGNSVYSVLSWNFIHSMKANDKFTLMWAVSDSSLYINAPTATAFCPAVPSVLLTVTEVAL